MVGCMSLKPARSGGSCLMRRHGKTKGTYSRIVTGLPGDGNHTRKTLRMGPDGWLYFNVGSSCNVCVEKDARRGTLMRVSPDGSRSEIHATGLRNSMGFDWSPRDGALYATENARDLLGDDFPPEELNRIEPGKFYGWPYVNARGDADPDFGKQLPQGTVATNPVHTFAAHNAPLGMVFLRSGAYPPEFHHNALVALHGSWNRSKKDGYKVVRLSWDTGGNITQRDFMTGFLINDNVIGRPVDIVEAPDGSIYVSDDFNGSVYRLAYGEAGQSARLPATAPESVQRTLRPTLSAEMERKGQELLSQNDCETCHGESATLAKTLVPLKDLATRYDQGSLVALFKAPPSSMPPVPLGNAELELLADFLLATR
jgi:glucose/arabinose dehydrogenase